MPYHYPGHKYLGPGTEDFTAEPVDEDDRIAQEHDLAYLGARTNEDIRSADRQAIGGFAKDFFKHGNFHSALGALGLSGKYAVETLAGRPLYPNMNRSKADFNRAVYGARQRFIAQYARANNISYQAAQRDQSRILRSSEDWAREYNNLQREFNQSGFERASDRLNRNRGLGQPLASSTQRPGPSTADDETVDPFDNMELFQQITGTGQQPTAMDTVDTPSKRETGGGGGQTIGGGPSIMGQAANLQILHNPSISPSTWSIRPSHLFQTWGYKFHMYDNTTDKAKSYLLHYPLAVLPVDFLPFYLSPQEFQALPRGTYVQEVIVKVTPKGIRCSFDTASTLSGHANNQQTVFGITAIGLNHKYLLRHRKVNANNTTPMNPTYTEITAADLQRIVSRMWGSKTTETNFATDFPTSLWTIRSLPFYTGIFLPRDKENEAFTLDTGHIDLTSHTNVFNILDHKDMPCLNYSYRPKFSPIKVKQNISSTDSIVPKAHTFHANVFAIYDVKLKFDGGKMTSVFDKESDSIAWEGENAYMVPLEQGSYKTVASQQFHTVTQPQVHIGILPVQSNAPSDVDADFVNASGLYYVETEIVLTTDINSYYNRADVAAPSASVFDREYNTPAMYNIEHVYGYMSCHK